MQNAQDISDIVEQELREGRKLFFHETAPWLAIRIRDARKTFDPVLLKRHILTFDDPHSFVDFETLREIYEGFVNSVTELHRFVLERVRLQELKFEPREVGLI